MAKVARKIIGPSTAKLDSVRFFISGGAPCPIPLIEAWQGRGLVFKQGYGLTETSPVAIVCRIDHEFSGSVGLPIPSTDVSIRDDDGKLFLYYVQLPGFRISVLPMATRASGA